MACQHPNCSYPIYSICENHCHWSLCEKHINEHRKYLIVEFEESLQALIKPTNQLTNMIDTTKRSLNVEYEKQLEFVKQSYQEQTNGMNQKLMKISQIQDEFHKITEQLIKVKANEILLTHNDFQRIDFLSKEIVHFMNSLKGKQDEIFNSKQIENKYEYCPLINLNTYGLSISHNVPLCSPEKKTICLFQHLCKYHHLKSHYATELIKAVRNNLDPMETKIFPLNTKIITVDDKYPCPLSHTPKENGIRCTPCNSMVTRKFLPIHLKTVHRLRATQINEIIKRN